MAAKQGPIAFLSLNNWSSSSRLAGSNYQSRDLSRKKCDKPGELGYVSAPAWAARLKGCSSIGRASVSKTEGWGFETLRPCQVLGGLVLGLEARGADLRAVKPNRQATGRAASTAFGS